MGDDPHSPLKTELGPVPVRAQNWLSSSVFAISMFCVLLLACFSPFIWQGKALAPLDIMSAFYSPWAASAAEQREISVHNHFVTDAVDQYLIYRWFAAASMKQDGYVGWSPLTFAGRPEYANTMATYFDWSVQLHRLLDFWDAWHAGLLLQFAIAGIGMFVFLRARPLRPPVCLAGAIAYAGNSQFVVWMYHRWALGSFCWVPWILWSLGSIKDRSCPVRAVTFAVFTALAMLGGNLQYDAFVLLVIVCFLGGCYLQDRPSPIVGLKRAAVVIVSLGFVAVLTVMMFVPCIRGFFDTAAVGYNRATLHYLYGWRETLLHPAVSILSAFPTVLGNPRTLDLTKLIGDNYFDVVYFGFLPVVVAFYSLGQRKTPQPAWLLMLCGLILPLTPLQGFVYYRISLLFVFGGIWAFAEFWEALDREAARSFANTALWIFFGLSLIWLGLSIVVSVKQAAIVNWIQAHLISQLSLSWRHLGVFRVWMLERAKKWVDEFPIWSGRSLLAWALAGISLLLVRFRRTLRDPFATHMLSVVLAVQVFTFAAGWLTVSPRPSTGVLPASKQIDKLKQIVGSGRVRVVTAEENQPFLPPNTLAAFGIASLDGYESILFRGILYEARNSPDIEKTSSLLGVSYAILMRDAHATSRDCWAPNVYFGALRRSGGTDTYCWPLVYSSSSFDLYKNAQAAPHYSGLGGSTEELALTPIMETFNRRILRVPSGINAVRVTENWSREWRYRTDRGDWQPAKHSDDMAILLPIGASDKERLVELQFWPFGWPRRISLIGWLIAGATLLAAAGRRIAQAMRGDSFPLA